VKSMRDYLVPILMGLFDLVTGLVFQTVFD